MKLVPGKQLLVSKNGGSGNLGRFIFKYLINYRSTSFIELSCFDAEVNIFVSERSEFS